MHFWIYILLAVAPCIVAEDVTTISPGNVSVSCSNGTDNSTQCERDINPITCTPIVTCNNSEKRQFNRTCSEIDFTFTKSARLLQVSLDQYVNISCNKTRMDILGDSSNLTLKRVRFTKRDHGKILSCYDDRNGTKLEGSFEVTVDIYMKPSADTTRVSFESTGEPITMKVSFDANPATVSRGNISITHKGSTFANFFYRVNGLTHELLLSVEKITEETTGEYAIIISGQDTLCQDTELKIIAVLTKSFHVGWIVTISLGAVCFILLVTVIALAIARCRARGGKSSSNVEMNTKARPIVDSTPVNGLQPGTNTRIPPSRPLPSTAAAPRAHAQQHPQSPASYNNRFSDDEFESDGSDYEETATGTMDRRPPMPLPKENPGAFAPRSPATSRGYVNTPNNYSPMNGGTLPTSPRNLPPPPVGYPPSSRPPASPAHRTLPRPPPLANNFGHGEGPRY